MIMREKVACRLPRRTLLAIGAVALLALPSFTLGQDKPKPADPPTVEEQWRLLLNPAEGPGKPGETARHRGILIADLDEDGFPDLLLVLDDPNNRDQKLAELEARLQEMLKEIQALKGKSAQQPDTQKHIELGLKYLAKTQSDLQKQQARAQEAEALARQKERIYRFTELMKDGKPDVITLSRVTYGLPPGKAAALAGLLKDHVKATPLETKVDGDKLIITTTPDKQAAIHGLIGLLQTPPTDKPK